MKHGIRVDRKNHHTIVTVDGWGLRDEFVVKSCNVEKPDLDKDWPRNVRDAVHKRLNQDQGGAEGRVLILFKLYLKNEASKAAVLLYHIAGGDRIVILRIGTPSDVEPDYLPAVSVILVTCAKAVAKEIDPKAQAIRWKCNTAPEEKLARSLGFTKLVGRGDDRTGRILEAAI